MPWNLRYLEETLLIGSTLVEGSTLSESEARKVLQGKTIQGHPISEAQEILNYRAAVQWLIAQLRKSPYLSQDLVLSFHSFLFQGLPGTHGRWKSSRNFTYLSDGSRYDYASPNEIETLMREWIDRYNSKPESEAAIAIGRLYFEFQRIHPFDDGNGRIGRILAAYWLEWKFKMSFHFKLKDKIDHLKALEAANHGDSGLLIQFFKTHIHPGDRR